MAQIDRLTLVQLLFERGKRTVTEYIALKQQVESQIASLSDEQRNIWKGSWENE
jgi:cell division protein FtsB